MTKNTARNIILSILFCLFIGAGMILHLAIPDDAYSETEKRPLEAFPETNVSSLTSGRFMSAFDRYANDQFPARPFFVGLKSESEAAIGRFDNGRVWFGRDGYLVEKVTKAPNLHYHAESLHIFQDMLSRVSPETNRYLLIAPTITTTKPSILPSYTPVVDQMSALAKMYAQSGDYEIIDVKTALTAETNGPSFYRNDHHWTTDGAYAAFQVFAKAAGLTDREDYQAEILVPSFLGTTYAKAALFNPVPDTIAIQRPAMASDPNDLVAVYDKQDALLQTGIYRYDNIAASDPYLVFLGQNVDYLRLETKADNDQQLLLIKDSYANSFIPFLTAHYGTIHVVDLRYFSGSMETLIKEEGPFADALLLYNFVTFADDTNLYRLER